MDFNIILCTDIEVMFLSDGNPRLIRVLISITENHRNLCITLTGKNTFLLTFLHQVWMVSDPCYNLQYKINKKKSYHKSLSGQNIKH